MLGSRVAHISDLRGGALLSAVAGWGVKQNTLQARKYALDHGLPYLSLEDGFLRSFGTGERFPPLSVEVDREGFRTDSAGDGQPQYASARLIISGL
ncbi:MAG: hypothetical protein RI826_03230 [Chlorobium phaeovibrioides]|nr:hypothetical protein [Chlorobium phaeovibrioides]